MEKKPGEGLQTTINISDGSGQSGKVQLKTWGPNKKTKECTIQVDKIKGEDVKFVKLFAETSVMHVLEEAFKGHNIKLLSKSTNLSTCGGYTNEL